MQGKNKKECSAYLLMRIAQLVLQDGLAVDQRLDFVRECEERLGQSLDELKVGHVTWMPAGAAAFVSSSIGGLAGLHEEQEGRELWLAAKLFRLGFSVFGQAGALHFRGQALCLAGSGHSAHSVGAHPRSRAPFRFGNLMRPGLNTDLESACFGGRTSQ